jgi:hypothetical protein
VTPTGTFFHNAYVVGDLDGIQQELAASLGMSFTPVQQLQMDVSDWRGQFRFPNCFVMSLDPANPVELIPARRGTVFESSEPMAFHHTAYWSEDLRSEVEGLVAYGLELELWGNGPQEGVNDFAFLRHPSGLRLELVDSALRAGFEDVLARAR